VLGIRCHYCYCYYYGNLAWLCIFKGKGSNVYDRVSAFITVKANVMHKTLQAERGNCEKKALTRMPEECRSHHFGSGCVSYHLYSLFIFLVWQNGKNTESL
jgi:hypothetical protein